MTGFMNTLERVHFENDAAQTAALLQLGKYRKKEGLFGRRAAAEAARTMPAHAWWSLCGACVPELQKVAIRTLSQVRYKQPPPYRLSFMDADLLKLPFE